jgi:ketosteroid isomerase-like protein
MHPNAALLHKFYDAFAKRDAETMATCYAKNATFRDPAFDLAGDGPAWMWRMLCARGKDLHVVGSKIEANETSGSAHWEADYTFSATGRKVHNVIEAAFTFEDGLIATHVDTFDFRVWSKQALGLPALLFGGMAFFQRAVSKKAMQGLADYRASGK